MMLSALDPEQWTVLAAAASPLVYGIGAGLIELAARLHRVTARLEREAGIR